MMKPLTCRSDLVIKFLDLCPGYSRIDIYDAALERHLCRIADLSHPHSTSSLSPERMIT